MRLKATLLAGLVSAPFSVALAETIQPDDVVFQEGAIGVSLTGRPGDPENGAALMNKGSGNCIACHEVSALRDLPFHGEIGPALDGAADRWTEAELRGIVSNAKLMFEGTVMPSFYKTSGFIRPGDAYTGNAAVGALQPLLTAQEVEDVVAFLVTLKEE
ncbi:MAG: sulfur oxidation c-type cytochrome SoxX [Pseudomonadota bacterium]